MTNNLEAANNLIRQGYLTSQNSFVSCHAWKVIILTQCTLGIEAEETDLKGKVS